jgi:serine/threonine-protein kinase
LIDLGLARRASPGDDDVPRDELCGTPSFMAPELMRGAPASVASDVYAIGGIFYALATGLLPVSGTSPISVVMKVMASEAEVVCDCGAGPLAALLRRALQRDPSRRFASTGQMQIALVQAVLCDGPRDERAACRRPPVDPEAMSLAA